MTSIEKKTVLIVDHDLGFVFWLGQALDRFGHVALPARSGVDGLAVLRDLHVSVDLVVINPGVPDAAELISGLASCEGAPQVLALLDPEEPVQSLPRVTASLQKPVLPGAYAKDQFLHHMELFLAPRVMATQPESRMASAWLN